MHGHQAICMLSWPSLLTIWIRTGSWVCIIMLLLLWVVTRFITEELLIDFWELIGEHFSENMANAVWETLVMYRIERRVDITYLIHADLLTDMMLRPASYLGARSLIVLIFRHYTVLLGRLSMTTRLTLDLAEISILSSYVLFSLNLYAYHLWKDFSRFHSHPPPDSPPLIYIRIAQFYFDSFHLFFYGRVSLLRTFWCISKIITCLVTLLWLDLYVLVYKDACKGHSLFRLGLLCESRTLNPPLSFTHSCSLSSSHCIVSILCVKALTLVCNLI